jgi:hypothetical protein
MYDIIVNQVVPKWTSYMKSKTKRRENDARLKPRNDTLWKKLVRDTREFYRTLFRKRFDVLTLNTAESALDAMKTMFEELGMPLSDKEAADIKLYGFIHQTHKYTCNRLFKNYVRDDSSSPFDLIERYNEDNLVEFMKHNLASRMIYFVFINFLKEYVPLISINYKKQLATLICCLLNCYKKMKKQEHLQRIEFWIRGDKICNHH